MTQFELSPHLSLDAAPNKALIISQLDLERNTRVSPAEANAFAVSALNRADGTRMIDVSDAFASVRHVLGSSLDWALGYPVSKQSRKRIGECVNAELEALVREDGTSGVKLLRLERDGDQCIKTPCEMPRNPARYLPKGMALLVPIGMTSPRLFGDEAYLRFDVERSCNAKSVFVASDVLLTDAAGNSIVGFGAVTGYLCNLDDVQHAIMGIVGPEYDPIRLNTKVYDGWWCHCQRNPDEAEFRIPLDEKDPDGKAVAMRMIREGGHAWRIFIEYDSDLYDPAEFVFGDGIDVNVDELLNDRDHVIAVVKQCESPESQVAYDHIFCDHADRLPLEVQDRLNTDPEAVIENFQKEFKASIRRFHIDPKSWLTTMFYGGVEKELAYNGDAALSKVQLLAPVYLTDTDKSFDRPSVYVVASVNRDRTSGEEYCSFPTILDRRIVQLNRNSMRRAIRAALQKQAA